MSGNVRKETPAGAGLRMRDETQRTRLVVDQTKALKYVRAPVAVVVLLLCDQARAAGQTMPINFIGDWCYSSKESQTTSYTLPSWTEGGHCTKILSIVQDQFYGEGTHCDPEKVRLKKDTHPSGTAYTATIVARCGPDGPVTAGKIQKFEFYRYKGKLTVTEKK
jgi:hypothetical protein